MRALVLSCAADNVAAGVSLLAMVTTAGRSAWPRDIVITAWRDYGLKSPCVVRTKRFSIDNRLIARRLAPLAALDRETARAALQGLIAL